jgi:hypothetical protein
MVDDLLLLLKVCNPTEQLINLIVCVVLLETLRKFLQLSNLIQQVVDVGVQLLNHSANFLLEFDPFFLNALLLAAHYLRERIQYLGSFMEGLVVFLREAVVNRVEVLEPAFD